MDVWPIIPLVCAPHFGGFAIIGGQAQPADNVLDAGRGPAFRQGEQRCQARRRSCRGGRAQVGGSHRRSQHLRFRDQRFLSGRLADGTGAGARADPRGLSRKRLRAQMPAEPDLPTIRGLSRR
jgi:hypothetical protein